MDSLIPVQNIAVGDYQLLSSFQCIAGNNEDISWVIFDHTPDALHVTFHFDKDEKEEKSYTELKEGNKNELHITVYNIQENGRSMIYMMPICTYDEKEMFLSYYVEANKMFHARIITFNLYTKNKEDGKD